MRLVLLLVALVAAPAAHAQLPLLYPLDSPNAGNDGAFGTAVATVPDVDGDGRPDLLVGAPGEDTPAGDASGRAYVLSGLTGAPLATLVSPAGRANGAFGCSVAAVPDVTGDGRAEYLVGACGEGSPGTDGYVYLLSGLTGESIRRFSSPNAINAGCFGCAVASLPDVSGDGVADLFVGASSEGNAYVFSGASGTLLRTLTSPSPTRNFGSAVAGVPDTDGDGRADLLVGERGVRAAAGGTSMRGRAYLFSGATGAVLRTLTGSIPALTGTLFGVSVAGLPDVTGDGRGDLAVGASREVPVGDSGEGRVYAFNGATGALLFVVSNPSLEAVAAFGEAVAVVPDVTGDGRVDLLVGAPTANGGVADAGRAYLVSGRDGAVLGSLVSPNARADGQFGGAVVAGADVDGDGRADLVVGARGESGGSAGLDDAGRAYVFSTSTIVAAEPDPTASALDFRAAPNPARGATTLSFTLDRSGPVRLAVFDALGREVAVLVDGTRLAGDYGAALSAARLTPGVYLARLTTPDGAATRLVSVVR